MKSENPDAKLIFGEALRLSLPAERQAYLDKACARNKELLQEVESLLSAYEQAGDFLGKIVPPPVPDFLVERPGTVIGRYKLLEKIGEGGFGVVYMAEQEEPVRRRVALKIIKLGMDTKEVVARFEAERQALALMEHPNIARVFDGGATDTGRPFFVMELVKGVPITNYCDANKLCTRERLELFIEICQAVQHAHQKGVIHRDLKPSNILVTVRDDRPVPKVIDFGVAKATQAQLTEKTLFTRFHQWIGTPAYMSPEQAGLGSLDVDTRSDVYSLGVLLYELLTGWPPFDTQKLLASGYDAVMRTIREEEPPKPSTRLSALAAEELSAVAAKRGAEPAKLGRSVRGDLDWIAMKALEKNRARRYDTAAALAQDIERHLHEEPVAAAGPSSLYRLQKFAWRHRRPLAMVAAGLLALVATLVGMLQTTRQRAKALDAEMRMSNSQRRASVRHIKNVGAIEIAEKELGNLFQAGQGNEGLEFALVELRLAWAKTLLEDPRADKNECEQAQILAELLLRMNIQTNHWHYGDIIYEAHSILGRAALRQGNLDQAKHHLLEAGKTPGSPSLNSFGPDFLLASELLAKGEREVVLQHLNQVSKFYGVAMLRKNVKETPSQRDSRMRHARELDQWKTAIRLGMRPDEVRWE